MVKNGPKKKPLTQGCGGLLMGRQLRPNGCNLHQGLYPFLRIGFKTNPVRSFLEERLIFGLSQLCHSNRDLLALIAQNRKLKTQLV